MNIRRYLVLLSGMAAGLCLSTAVNAQPLVQENFDGATGVGGGEFFVGSGEEVISDWDTGLMGESAFAGATVRAFSHAAASGDPAAGVDGSGAGVISVSDVSYNPLHLNFENVLGNPGGGVFMDSASGAEGYTENWDNAIEGEAAFGGVADGAVLNGTMSAQAIPGAGYAQLDVTDVNAGAGTWYAGLMFEAPALEGAVTLVNGGFEEIDNGAADQITGWTGWGEWGGPYAETATGDPAHPFTPYEGERSLKMFGWSGLYQDLPAEPGQTWEINAYVMAPANDPMGLENFASASIEFRNAADEVIGTNGAVILTSASPQDLWMPITPVSATAPAGTVSARILFTHSVPLFEGGAVLIDAATFTVVAGPPQSAVDLSAIELTASVRGTVDAAGETLGDYQLRIEDGEGDRLVFSGTANGDWQTIGGPLSTATEVNSEGIATNGVFNTAASSFTVVLVFDNDTTLTWGTGGTLDLDELVLSGSDPLDSNWYAGLFWDGLTIAQPDLNELSLTADVKGDVPGGAYVLRLEGFVINSNGVDEPFTDASFTGNHVILTYDMTTSGVYSGWTDNWDTDLIGEAAFGGLDSGSRFCSPAECPPGVTDVGITARALSSGGNPGACGQIKLTGLWEVAPGGDWWGGLMWQDQALAGGDLSQVELRADVKGIANASLFEQLGSIELRIEDEDGDRLYKQVTATTSWQTIGGTLDTFTEAGPASGVGGSGAFDTDDANYTVVIAFNDPAATWVWGGAIHVDNVFLTPAEVAVELGRVSFTGMADGSFQSVGGVLSAGDSTFVTDLQEDMESGAGEGVTFWPGNWGDADFDSGLQDDAYFGGTWGAGSLGAATARSCTTCGFNGSKGIEMIVENPAGAGWYTGLAFNDQRLEIDNLGDIIMTARVKGTPADGGSYGTIALKLEDPNLDAMEFLIVADGTWQTVGGPLSTANEVASGNTSQGSDGVFDVNAPWYKVIVQTWGPTSGTPGWNSTHTFAVDDIFLTRPGYSIEHADVFTVALAFENEIATWGNSGTLTLDNLLFGAALGSADCDVDGDVDLVDFAAFQACFNTPASGACECADIDGDMDIDLDDLGHFNNQLMGPQ